RPAGIATSATPPLAPRRSAVGETSPTTTIISTAARGAADYGPCYTVAATASSGLAVTFGSSTLPVCTLNGSTVSFVGVGTCTVTANQAGNANYAAAPPTPPSSAVATAEPTTSASTVPRNTVDNGPSSGAA